MNKLKYVLGALLSLGLLAAALSFLYKVSHRYKYEDIVAHIHELPMLQVLMALLLTIASYGLLTIYDKLAVNYVGHPLPYRRVGLASFIGYTFSNNLGFALLTGTSVRYRLYTLWGMKPAQIAQVVLFCSVTFFLGLFFVGGLAMVFAMPPLPPDLALPDWVRLVLDWVGWIAVATGLAYLAMPLFWKKPLQFKGISLPVPTFKLSAAQLAVAGLDWIAASAVFYALLPPVEGLTYWNVLTIFMAGNILGVMAHVPGGIGVFESVATFLLAPFLPAPQILGSLVAYRVVYYVLPFILALLSFAAYELMQKRHLLKNVTPPAVHALLPVLLAISSFIAGAVLLISCATPTVPGRLASLMQWLPLSALEASHLLACAVGTALLLVSRGLIRRQESAWKLVRALLGAAIVLALLKGLDYEEAAFAALVLLALLPAREEFSRHGPVSSVPLSPSWLSGVAVALFAALWFASLAYKEQVLSWADPALLSLYSFEADAARTARGALVVVALVLLFLAMRLQHAWKLRTP